VTANGIYEWTDPDSDGVATALLNAGAGIALPIAESDVTGLVTDLAAKAPLASPTFTGHPVGVTETASNNSTRLASTAYGDAAVAVETSRATAAEALLAPKASPTFTGTVTVPNGSAATDAAAYGQIPVVGAVGGFPKVVIRTANSNTISSNNVLASDDTLLWAVGASDRWFFQAMITFTAADSSGTATTADAQVGWSVPTGGVMQWGPFGNLGNAAGGYGYTAAASSPLAVQTAASALAQGGAAVTWGVALCGFYTGDGSHAGNVNLQWAQNTSNAATLLIGKDSSLICWRLA
jgi:hypothetical protein